MTELNDIGTAHQRQFSSTGGAKDNALKPAVDQLPVKPLLEAGRVAGYGGHKYAPMNWRRGLSYNQQCGSILRHILAFLDGEELDPESGLHHLAHATTQTLYLHEFVISKTGDDDRWINNLSNPNRREAE